MTPPDDQARRFLDTDPVNHAKALESLRRHTGRIVAQSRAGVVVHDGPSDTFLIMTAADPARPGTGAPVDDLVARLDPAAVHQCEVFPAAAAPLVGRRFHLITDAHYVMAVARSGWRRGADDVPGVALVPVGPRSPDLELYPQSGRAYARTRADDGTLWAARLDGRAVGFIGTHDDGSIGLLQVLPRGGAAASARCCCPSWSSASSPTPPSPAPRSTSTTPPRSACTGASACWSAPGSPRGWPNRTPHGRHDRDRAGAARGGGPPARP